MARRVSSAALFTVVAALVLLSPGYLHAQTDGVESGVPEAGFGPPPAAAPPAPSGIALPGNSSAPTIHVFSRETIFDVLVSDSKGEPVRGLTRKDFIILEDNHPIDIRGFNENSTTLAPREAVLSPNIYSNANTLPANGPVQIFLVEKAVVTSSSSAGSIISVPPAMLDYLRTMPAGTQVAIFTFSPVTALQMVQGFTTDGNAAASAAARILPDVDLAPAFRGPSTRILHIAAMQQIAAYVASIHGRKNLIWITGGMPLMVDRDGGYELSISAPDMSIVHRLMDTYEVFSREQIAIYPVNPGGVHGPMDYPQQAVADQTGGTNANTNDIKGEIADIVNRSSGSYTLSFAPPRPNEDARFHSIKVLVDRPGLTLTYRTGYDDDHPRPPDHMLKADLLPAPMRVGALPTTQLLFDLEAEPTPSSNSAAYATAEATVKQGTGSGKTKLANSLKGTPYDVIFRFDPKQIAFAEGSGGKRTANLEFDLGAYDSYAQLIVARSQTINITLSPAEYDEFMKTPFQFYLPIPLPHGQLTLRAGLFDTVANTSGSLQLPLTIAKQLLKK
jgi:VWFA-related protein